MINWFEQFFVQYGRILYEFLLHWKPVVDEMMQHYVMDNMQDIVRDTAPVTVVLNKVYDTFDNDSVTVYILLHFQVWWICWSHPSH